MSMYKQILKLHLKLHLKKTIYIIILKVEAVTKSSEESSLQTLPFNL